MKIKLLRPLWNKKRDDIMEVTEPNGTWAVNKGYAEFIPSSIEPIQAKVVTEYDTKVIVPVIEGSKLVTMLDKLDKEVKKRGRKAK